MSEYYLYRERIVTPKRDIIVPTLYEDEPRLGFATSHMDSEGLKGLASHVASKGSMLRRDYELPEIVMRVRKHAPAREMASGRTQLIHPQQMRVFEKYIPDKIIIDWIDERENEDFIQRLEEYQKIFKKKSS